MATMICSHCGDGSPDSAKFCRKCGNTLRAYDSEITSAITRPVSDSDVLLFPQAAAPVIKLEDIPEALTSKQKSAKSVSYTKIAARGAIIGAIAAAFISPIPYLTFYRPDDFDGAALTAFFCGIAGFFIGLVGLPFLYYAWKD